jgi:hypothetical protein
MTTMLTQLGFVDEVAYGTPLTPTRFFEYTSESVKLQMGRIQSAGLRAGTRTPRADRFQPQRNGAAGGLVFDVPTKGFGYLLKHMLGTVSTGVVVDSNFTHTGTEGSLTGDFFTAQLNRPLNPSGTAQPFTYHGGKIVDWELACDVDGVLMTSLGCDFEDEDTSTALATAVYPASYNVFTWAQGAVTFGGTSVELKSFKVAGKNGLNVDRRYIRNSTLKKEPVESVMREYTWSAQMDFSDLVQYNRYRDALAANTLMQIIATFQGPVAHGGTTLPSLVVTMPAARVDAADVNISGPEELMIDVSGIGMTPAAGGSPVTIAYTTTDATP